MNRIKYLLICLLFSNVPVVGQESKDSDSTVKKTELRDDALAVSGRFSRFERLLSQMADLLAVEDPERAELLRRAISQSRENAIGTNINAVVEMLNDDSLGDAINKQEATASAMAELLKLLQSEDRRSAVERERERLNDILKNVRNAISQQRAARASTQNSPAPSNAAPKQQKAMNQTDEILDGIKDHDAAKEAEENSGDADDETDGVPKDGKPSDPKSGDPNDKGEGKKPDDASNGNNKPQDDKNTDSNSDPKSPKDSPKDSQGKPGDPKIGDDESKPSEGGKPSDSESPSESKDSKSQQSNSGKNGPKSQQQKEQDTPGRKELEQARQLMQEALEQLKEQEREEAVESQDNAIAEMENAAKELEELLRQLREEEKEMVLEALEARLQRLLAQQTQIYETTVSLGEIAREEWLDTAVSECRELAQQQNKLTQRCGQTTSLLREDGTSVSILLAVEDIEVDMGTIAERLQNTKAGRLTQTMETDVIEALKELIEETQKEMQDMKSEERQQQQQQQQTQKKPDLVELMAELRVLRSLQLRVNRRTKNINELLQENDPNETVELQIQLSELARRQDRLRESAIELAKKLER